jgi:hypothetical protein
MKGTFPYNVILVKQDGASANLYLISRLMAITNDYMTPSMEIKLQMFQNIFYGIGIIN